MKNLIAFALMIMAQVINPISAAEPITYKLWQNGAPTSNGIAKGLEQSDSTGWITFVSVPEITVYPADRPSGTALLLCPGGGYFGLSSLYEGSALAQPLNEIGVTLAVLKYRMPNGHHEVPREDALRALDILNDKASELKIDPEKIGIGGASAGGHLAATVISHPGKIAPAFQVLFYPVITMSEEFTHSGSRNLLLGDKPSENLIEYFSNELYVSSETPPTFIAVSQNDPAVPLRNSTDYFRALVANNVQVSFHVYPTGGHGWLCNPDFTYLNQALTELTNWLVSFGR